MSYAEFIEWIAYFQAESAGGSPSVPHWQKMMQSMRLVTEFQKAKQ